MKIFETTEHNNTTHALRIDTINHLELFEENVRLSYANEIILLAYNSNEEAQEIYTTIIKLMKDTKI